LRLIIEKGLGEDAERRTNAIRAFVRDQFDRDEEVRFKQIELGTEKGTSLGTEKGTSLILAE
jgi:hypothetical protein